MMIWPGADHDTMARQQLASRDLTRLALAAQRGARDDLEVLLQQVRTIAHRYSWARLSAYPGGLHLADDVAQDICIAVFRALPGYRDRGRPFEAFVHGVASRKVADARRALLRHPLPTAEFPDEIDDSPTPEDRVVQSADLEAASELLCLLPDRLREIMVLRVGAGMTAEETGAALDMTPGA